MDQQLKRWIAHSCLLAGLLGLTACGGGGGGNDTNPPGTNPPGTNPPGTNPPATTLTAVNDAYTWLGNSRIIVPAANGVLGNDTLATGVVPTQKLSAQGGTTTISADGGFTYEAPRAFIGTDTFTYTATDASGATATGTVTITINQLAWYVKNDGGAGQGTSTSPFNTLATAAAASGPGSIIFVFTGDGTAARQNAGIDLLANQKLIGQGVGLTFDVLPNNPNNLPLPINGGSAALATSPGAAPVISDTVTALINNLPIVGLASGTEVAGVIIDGTGALANMRGLFGTDIAGFNIHDNTIRNIQRSAILLAGATGGTGIIAGNTISNLLGPNPENAIDIVTPAAGVNFSITGNTLSNATETGARVQFGSGTVTVTGNTLTNVGTAAGRRGIDIEGTGTTTISGNTVDNSAGLAVARSGIQLNASGTLNASVTGNTVLNATAADGGIQAQTTVATASLCLRMTGNTTANNFVLDNRTTANLPASFRIEGPLQANFEAANTATGGVFSYLLNVNAVSFVPVGTCGFVP